MIPADKILVSIPTHDGSIVAGCAGGLIACGQLYRGLHFQIGNSHVALARNLQVAAFLASPFDWIVMIDADIQFSHDDFMQLIFDDEENEDNHLLKVAEYAKKDLKAPKPAQFGLGFTLAHRSIFPRLREVTLYSNGAAMVNGFMWKGEWIYDYFPSGATPEGHWLGEDHGFFLLCKMAGIIPRVLTTTNLIHHGNFAYPYTPSADESVVRSEASEFVMEIPE